MQRILAIVQDDVGGRGIRHLLNPHRDVVALEAAATGLLHLPSGSHVAILTGFPCVQHATPPTETDGIAGTFALVHMLHTRGCVVHILTDDVNASVFQACIDHWRNNYSCQADNNLQLHTFPPGPVAPPQLEAMAALMQYWIAIERPGAAADGRYYTMRAVDISRDVAHLDAFFDRAQQIGVRTLAIGDGGNELGTFDICTYWPRLRSISIFTGLGGVATLTNQHIPHGNVIAAVTPSDHLVVASISDWGGYAICAAMAYIDPSLSLVLPRTLAELAATMVMACARDGILGTLDACVDGWPLVVSLNRLHQLTYLERRRDFRLLACHPHSPTLISAALLVESPDNIDAVRTWQTHHTRLGVVGGSAQVLQQLVAVAGIYVAIHVLVEYNEAMLASHVPWCQKQRIGLWVAVSSESTATGRWLLDQPWVDAVLSHDTTQLHDLMDCIGQAVVKPWSSGGH
ncbi:hypothetical protein DYB36_008712 [Aphanomyces astaci]|uniref:D-glutamate cyclase-like C-terminal domain-containing protein n=1 Tax=Aphanomyces astaci TaxID=112090 RepID=A0A396ZZ09_APHAT|nr:hypothetical protein DYB36_008712 [Aphanomyces astaci]